MNTIMARALGVLAAGLACVAVSHAQNSKLIISSNASDITADGNTVMGFILDINVDGQLYRFNRGVGNTLIGPAIPSLDGDFSITDNGLFAVGALYNGIFGPRNPNFGYYAGNVACCNGSVCTTVDITLCTGSFTPLIGSSACSPNPCPAPAATGTLGVCCDPNTAFCTVTTRAACASPNYWMSSSTGTTPSCGSNPCKKGHFINHRLDVNAGTWTNIGAFPNVAGQGAAKCDLDINQPYGISGNGNFSIGSGNFGPFGATACNTRGFVWSAADNLVRLLPPTATGCQVFSQGEYISNDGLIAVGTDSVQSPNPAGQCNVRTLVVWERPNTTSDFTLANRTVLDPYGGGSLGNMAMTDDGTTIFADLSDDAALIQLGNGALAGSLVRYTKVSGVWTRAIIGKVVPPDGLPAVGAMIPRAVSDDGNTVTGLAIFGGRSSFFNPSRPFIWKNGVNGNIPMVFSEFLTQINGGTLPGFGAPGLTDAISADGNALIVAYAPPQVDCAPGTGLADLSRSAILYLNGNAINCEPPRIIGGPYSKNQQEFTQFGIVGNVFVNGSWPMQFQWQKEVPTGSGTWVNLTSSCGTFSTSTTNPWIYEGTRGFQLRINMLAPPADRDGNFRVVVTNDCGTATSQVATINTIVGACCYPESGQVVCSIELANRCTGSPVISFFRGGTYLGDNTTCSPSICDAAIGACCTGAGGPNANCTVTVQPSCTRPVADGGLGGTFAGLNTACGPAACGSVSGACCYSVSAGSNVICTVEVSGYCTGSLATGNLLGVYRGNATTCGPSSCSTVSGACCASPSVGESTICTIQTQARCENELRNGGLQGIYAGNGEVCQPADLCLAVSGACCAALSGTTDVVCTIQLQSVCTTPVNGRFINSKLVIGLGGVYGGDGALCGPTTCNAFAGSCCYTPFNQPCGVCTIQTQIRCTDPTNMGGLAGIWGGAGSTCSPAACGIAYSGACCAGTFCLVAQCATECTTTIGGIFQGAGTSCGPSTCGGASGVCCRGTTCNPTIAQAACTTSGTQYGASFNSTAAACSNASPTAPCCFADYDKTGGIQTADIFAYLNDWFASSTFADFGGDGTIGPDTNDIFSFLNAWFSGGC
ncbi:MAG: hypothetical protein K2W85_17415 [Phycisphaerales bacterium]|nr:hypothetical protein [Phycisphaerales bacterium]